MIKILVYIQHIDGEVTDDSYELLNVAQSLSDKIELLLFCENPENFNAQLNFSYKVTAFYSEGLNSYNPEIHIGILNEFIKESKPDLVLFTYNTCGLDVAPAVAVGNNLPLIGYVRKLSVSNKSVTTFSQVYGGKLIGETTTSLPAICVLMPGQNVENKLIRSDPNLSKVFINTSDYSRMNVVKALPTDKSDVDLTEVEKIICVGKGIGNSQNIEIASKLADKINGEIAGSRPVIDSGWLPKTRQVGKSGNKVKPKLYLCAGVSGAPEHIEGMKDSELIISLNTDENAPIFNVSTYGSTCDLFEVLPELTKLFQNK